MKIGIIGAGRMGCLVAGNATSGGAECFLVDPWKEHVDEINANGLTIFNNEDEPYNVKCKAFTSADQVGEIMDLIVVLVMGQHTRNAIEAAMCLADEHTYCITLQNGMGNVEVLEEYFPKERLLYGIMPYGGTVLGPGKVKTLTGAGDKSHFGCAGIEEPNDFMKEFATMMQSRGLEFYAENKADVDSAVWFKMALNCSGNPVCAVTRVALGPYTNCDATAPIEIGLFMECAAVAKVLGVNIDNWHWNTGRKLPKESKMYWHLPSTAQDVKAKRKTEIDYLNGAIARMGDKYGVPTPYNHMITAMVKIVEENYDNQF